MISRTIAVLFTILFAFACTASGTAINGYTLGSASFDGGKVHFVKDLKWALTRACHPTEELRLVGRDQWSVYLCGVSRSFEMQVDYWTRWVKENNVNKYQITAAAVGIINGRNIGTANYTSINNTGSFKHVASKTWVSTVAGSNSRVMLVETGRDECSVYLRTDNSLLMAQIDYHRRWIRFRPNGGVWYDAFPITGAAHSTIAHRYGC